jgi:hypothetical protein
MVVGNVLKKLESYCWFLQCSVHVQKGIKSMRLGEDSTLYQRVAAIWPEGVSFFAVNAIAGGVYKYAKATHNLEVQFATAALYLSAQMHLFKEKYYGVEVKDSYAELLVTTISSLSGAVLAAVSYEAGSSLSGYFR